MAENAASQQDSMGEGHAVSSVDRHRVAADRFIDFWGEMASSWGINRTMAQIHALLYAEEDPADTDAIMERLGISRGSANMNLRSLMQWNLVRRVHLEGSRKDFYTAEKDVWEIMAHIVEVRKQREVRPVLTQLETCRDVLEGGRGMKDLKPNERRFHERIERLIELMEVFEGFTETLIPLIQQRNAPIIRQMISFARELSRTGENRNGSPRNG